MVLGRYKTTVILITLLCVMGGAYGFLVMPHQDKLDMVRRQVHEREMVLAARKAECVQLNKAVYDLQYTPSTIERVARSKFKMCRPNERLYRY